MMDSNEVNREELLMGVLNASLSGIQVFKSIYDNSNNIIDFEWIVVNDAILKTYSKQREELIGKTLLNTYPGVRLDGLLDLYIKAAKGETQVFDLHYDKDGFDKWFRINAVPFRNGFILSSEDITQQVEAEQKLWKREEHLRALITATSDLIYKMNADWSEIEVLQGKVFVPEKGKFDSDWFKNNIPPIDRSVVRTTIDEAIKQKTVFQLEHRVRLADGSIGWTFSRAIPILDPKGEIIEWLGAASDVTERKNAEEASKESEERFRAIADDAPVFLFLAGENAEVEYLNKTWREYTGISLDDSKGRAWAEITHPDDVAPATKIYMDGFNKRQSCTFENRQKGTDEIYRTILWKATPRFSPTGQFIGMMGVGLDINDRKNAEDRLRESEAQLKSIMNNAPLGIGLYVGKDMIIKKHNQTFIDLLGKGPGIEGLPLREALPEILTEGQPFLKILDDVYTKGIPYSTEGTLVKLVKHGVMTNNVYNFSYTPILNNEGKTYAIVVISRDVTEQIMASQRLKESETRFRTQAEELESKNKQLIRTNNELDNFIYTASHDLKAPISNVEGLVNALNKLFYQEGKDNAQINSLIEMIYKSIARFKNTVIDLTEVAKVESIGEEAAAEVSFKELLEEVKVDIDELIKGSSALIIDDFNTTPSICFSRKNLRSIIYNLLSNGIKYCSPERTPQIHITSSYPNKEEILLTVQDNGLGIKEEDKYKVFSMFKRLHNHVEGTGIGLAIVKKIVDNNGGRIEIDSEVGKGSLFKVFFKVSMLK